MGNLRCLSLGLFVCLAPDIARALTLPATPMAQLWDRAQVVCVGEIESKTFRPWAGRVGGTWTEHHIRILRTLKGGSKTGLIVGLPGGVRKGIVTQVHGVPTLTTGKRYVFLLEKHRGEWIPLDYSRGLLPAGQRDDWNIEDLNAAFSSAMRHGYVVMQASSGKNVHWTNRCIDLWVSDLGSGRFSSDAIKGVVTESFERWSLAQGGDLSHQFRGYTCFDQVGFDDWPGPQNVIHFRQLEEAWIHPPKIAALTTILYRDDTGVVVDADIEFNEAYTKFTLDGSVDSFSLRYTMTHELGHLLGLDHSSLHSALMGVNSIPQKVGDFELHSDDRNAIVANYPAGVGTVACGTSRSFGEEAVYCPAKPDPGGCAAANDRTSWPWWLSLSTLVILARRRA